jgi:hypothetical protein
MAAVPRTRGGAAERERGGKDHPMRWQWRRAAATVFAIVFISTCISPPLHAQNQPNPDDLSKKYEDALAQLKAAQDRKNELATENEQLKARIAELEKQADEHRRAAAEYAQNTFFLRSHYAAWQTFIDRYPQLKTRWRVFLEGGLLGQDELPEGFDLSPLTSVDRWPRGFEGKP